MEAIAIWWLVVQLLGLSVLPLTRYVFRWLPDQGYAFARPLGILLCSYVLWLGASLGIIDNERSTIVIVVVLLAMFSWLGFVGRTGSLGDWWRQNKRSVVVVEVLFAGGLLALALLRAYDPAIAYTEKPMEFAFLNAVLRSERFPPVDPWMSGYAISYYYFGYVMAAVLTKASGLASSYTFNLSVALLFAMTLTGAFGVVHNLVRVAARRAVAPQRTAIKFGLLASGLVAVLGNLEGVVEVLNSKGLIPASLHTWLNIKDLPLGDPAGGWLPTTTWWWFRASRVIGDFDPLTGVSHDYTINEFPFFSFLLGDLHPHVLALPFAVMCVGLALNLAVSRRRWGLRDLVRSPVDFVVLGLAFGGLAFLNSWDLPTYLLVAVLIFAVREYWRGTSLGLPLLRKVALFGLGLLALSVVLYAPFYITFGSQAQGLGLVPVRTKLHHFVLFWGPLAVLAAGLVLSELSSLVAGAVRFRDGVEKALGRDWVYTGLGIALLLTVSVIVHAEVLALVVVGLAVVARVLLWKLDRPVFVSDQAALVEGGAARSAASDAGPGIEWAQFAMTGPEDTDSVSVRCEGRMPDGVSALADSRDVAGVFVLVLIAVSLALLAGTEVLFLRDLFGDRMNTIFKVYYQSWTLLSIACAYALYHLGSSGGWSVSTAASKLVSKAAIWLFAVLALACLVYPVASAVSKSNGFASGPEFDGTAYLRVASPSDYAAIEWLEASVAGTPVILEAPGKSYSQFSRVSANTGLPTVIGWDFHEYQWRGSYVEVGARRSDVDTIYRTGDIELAKRLLQKYGVTYVYVGDLEREAYGDGDGTSLRKFEQFMDVVYRSANVTIYRARGQADGR